MLLPATLISSIPEEKMKFSISSGLFTIHFFWAEKTAFRLSGRLSTTPFSQRVIRFLTKRISSGFLRLQPEFKGTEKSKRRTRKINQAGLGRLFIACRIPLIYYAGCEW